MDRKVGQPHLRLEIVVVVLIGALGAAGNVYLGLEILDAVDREALRFPVLGSVLEPIFGASHS